MNSKGDIKAKDRVQLGMWRPDGTFYQSSEADRTFYSQ